MVVMCFEVFICQLSEVKAPQVIIFFFRAAKEFESLFQIQGVRKSCVHKKIYTNLAILQSL